MQSVSQYTNWGYELGHQGRKEDSFSAYLDSSFLQWQSSQAVKLTVYFHEMVKLRMHGIKLPPSLTAWGQLHTFTRILSAATSSIDSEMYSKGVCDK
jgi:hypothetical protein